jgi:nitrite reductase/ring-hydroxylating ferredoxin subunit/uncharacterized membrane protein
VTRLSELAGRAVTAVESQRWLDKPSYKLENGLALVSTLLGDLGRPALNLLHGTWLGHPLHPVLTDIPVGAWTTALVLDVADAASGEEAGYRPAARASVGLGLAGAAAAALAGLADWQYTQDNARRVGLAHAGLNVAATGCYTLSWVYRGRGRRKRGRTASTIGYGLMAAAAYLGGDLVSRHRVGVDHADRRLIPREFVAVLADGELRERQPVRVDAAGRSVLLVRSGGTIHALGEECAHLGGPLSEGWLRGDTVVCPWHGSAYELATGQVRSGPATCPLPTLETRVVDGRIWVRCRPPSPGAPPGSVVSGEQERADAGH